MGKLASMRIPPSNERFQRFHSESPRRLCITVCIAAYKSFHVDKNFGIVDDLREIPPISERAGYFERETTD